MRQTRSRKIIARMTLPEASPINDNVIVIEDSSEKSPEKKEIQHEKEEQVEQVEGQHQENHEEEQEQAEEVHELDEQEEREESEEGGPSDQFLSYTVRHVSKIARSGLGITTGKIARSGLGVTTGIKPPHLFRPAAYLSDYLGFDVYQRTNVEASISGKKCNRTIIQKNGLPTLFEKRILLFEECLQKLTSKINHQRENLIRTIPSRFYKIEQMKLWMLLLPMMTECLINLNVSSSKKKGDIIIPQIMNCQCVQISCQTCTLNWIASKFSMDLQQFWLISRGKPQNNFYVPLWELNEAKFKSLQLLGSYLVCFKTVQKIFHDMIQVYMKFTGLRYIVLLAPYKDLNWDGDIPRQIRKFLPEKKSQSIQQILYGGPIQDYLLEKAQDPLWSFSESYENEMLKKVQKRAPMYYRSNI